MDEIPVSRHHRSHLLCCACSGLGMVVSNILRLNGMVEVEQFNHSSGCHREVWLSEAQASFHLGIAQILEEEYALLKP